MTFNQFLKILIFSILIEKQLMARPPAQKVKSRNSLQEPSILEPSGSKGDTHSYDGLIGDIYRSWQMMELVPVKEKSFEETTREISEHKLCTSKCIKYIELMRTDRKNNYDSKNKLNAEKLLSTAWEMVKGNEDYVRELVIQIEDISNGTCSQGRTTRLFQIISLVVNVS